MPEGPQVARYARLQNEKLAGKTISFDSPDGRFDELAGILDGATLLDIAAVGKHLVYAFDRERFLHVHLGRFGHFDHGTLPMPEIRGVLRFRFWSDTDWYELRGAIAVELFDEERVAALTGRIGPNPLDENADPKRALKAIRKSESAVGLLLMDQSVIGGIGNIYRSEALFVARVNPWLPGSQLDAKSWRTIWKSLVTWMPHAADGDGKIVTTAVKDRKKPGKVRREDRFYVYRRTGLPCRKCGAPIAAGVIATRNVFWCPVDQPAVATAKVSTPKPRRSTPASTRSKR